MKTYIYKYFFKRTRKIFNASKHFKQEENYQTTTRF